MQHNLDKQNQDQIKIQKDMLKRKRRSRRNQVKQCFHCECGKTYLSFSALYLHARIKHEMKLTTQEKSDICQVEKARGLAKYTYSISQANQKGSQEFFQQKKKSNNIKTSTTQSQHSSEENETENEAYPSCFKEYLAKPISNQEKRILTQFLKYAFPLYQETQKSSPEQIYELSYLFNPFVLDYLPKSHGFQVNTRRCRKICSILQNLHLWMKDSQMTDLVVFRQL